MNTRSATLTAADLEFDPPALDLGHIAEVVQAHYGINGEPRALRGERDQNVVINEADRSVLVKIAGAREEPEAVDLQIQALEYLEAAAPDLPVPRILRTTSGHDRIYVPASDGTKHVARVMTFLEGSSFEGVRDLAGDDLFAVGRQQGRLTAALVGFIHRGARRFMAWDTTNGLVDDDQIWSTAQADLVEIGRPLRGTWIAATLSSLARAPSQTIHNDGHPGNVLRGPGTTTPCGIIDFGDIVRGPAVNDLAVAAAGFAGSGDDGALDAVAALAAGFHEARPLSESELEVLFDAILLRHLQTVLLSDFQITHCPRHRGYATSVRQDGLDDLVDWLALDRDEATQTLRHQVLQ